VYSFLSSSNCLKPVVITGGAGFAGKHLTRKLVSDGCHVYCLDRMPQSSPDSKENIPSTTYHQVDLVNPHNLVSLLSDIKPREIYHLAGIANVKNSWMGQGETYSVNVLGEVNLLSAIKTTDLEMDCLIISSGEVYGHVPRDRQPIDESRHPDPRSPYAASKVCQEVIAHQTARQLKGKIVVVRPFNHIGPGQHYSFVTSDFARQISRAEKGLIEPRLSVGNLTASRDFTDVRDMVQGYIMALRQGRSGETYNICSGKPYKIQTILDLLLKKSSRQIEVITDPEKFRPLDIPYLQGSYTRFNTLTGWCPTHKIEDTLQEILDYWRAQTV
jgi:GDP-4-dehydro-6-deoxy-D-mannose reductase